MAAAVRLFAVERGTTVRGKLIQPATLLTPDGRRIHLTGDASTEGVMKDARVIGNELEVIGTFKSPGEFEIGPIHTKSMYVLKNGKRLFITYWCEVCSIRTYTPGKCWCCQENTELDLREHQEN
jgi:hypothetical protein